MPAERGRGKNENQLNVCQASRSVLRCFISILLFNPHNGSPDFTFFFPFVDEETAAQRGDETCKPEQAFTPNCWRRFRSCAAWSWAKSGLSASANGLYKWSSWAPFLSPFPTTSNLCLSLQAPSSKPFSVGDLTSQLMEKAEPLGGDFSNSSPLEPIKLPIETPQVFCEMRQSKINKWMKSMHLYLIHPHPLSSGLKMKHAFP